MWNIEGHDNIMAKAEEMIGQATDYFYLALTPGTFPALQPVLAEAVQTVMRRYGIPNPYEKLKALTRGQAVTKDVLLEFIGTLDIPEDEKRRLLELTPETYIGLAAQQARDI